MAILFFVSFRYLRSLPAANVLQILVVHVRKDSSLKILLFNSFGDLRDEFVNWVRKRTGLPARTVSSKVEAQAILDRNSTLVVGYFEKFEVQ